MSRKIKKLLGPNLFIKIEQTIGPPIAPSPKTRFKVPPEATNFSFGTKSFVCATLSGNKGSDAPA